MHVKQSVDVSALITAKVSAQVDYTNMVSDRMKKLTLVCFIFACFCRFEFFQ